jgi:hypothetical protein
VVHSAVRSVDGGVAMPRYLEELLRYRLGGGHGENSRRGVTRRGNTEGTRDRTNRTFRTSCSAQPCGFRMGARVAMGPPGFERRPANLPVEPFSRRAPARVCARVCAPCEHA